MSLQCLFFFFLKRELSLVTLPFWVLVPLMQSLPWQQIPFSHWPSLFCPDCQSWHDPASPFLPAPPGKKWNHKVFNGSDAGRQKGWIGEILVMEKQKRKWEKQLMLCVYWHVLQQWGAGTATSHRKNINRRLLRLKTTRLPFCLGCSWWGCVKL